MRTKMLNRRKALKLTQEDVAKRAGMTRANYAHIERGRHNPSIEQMKVIAKALKVKPDLNFFEKDCDESYQSNPDDEPQTA
ncbi:helix-turn-helix transcriptional regulator [Brevibacillus agri]|uniref:helix-turn-helix transcriptional regulator n=1 Tax=Brevibacillus agri TaxID=51101 RepID=UPI003D1CFC09